MFLTEILTLTLGSVARTHTTVSPEQAPAGSAEAFTVSTPGEMEIPIVEERVEVPQGFEVTSVDSPDGWQGSVEGDSVVWAGGELPEDEEQRFSFEALVPDQAGEYQWRAFDTYESGSVSEWTGAPDSDNPASVTEVPAGGVRTTEHGHDHGSGAHGSQEGDLPETGGLPLAALAAGLLAAGLNGLLLKRRRS